MITTAYAIDKKKQIFPSKGIHGICIDCGEEVVSKCGTIVSHHFAHKSVTNCGNSLHDNKSDWHRKWQHTLIPAIPGENVEVTISDNKTIKRADLISNSGYIVEFQHSPLSITERLEREHHYKKIIWVVHTDRMNSRTWKHNVSPSVPVFFNGDNDGMLLDGYIALKKQKFIKWIINSKHFDKEALETTKQRFKEKGASRYNDWDLDLGYMFFLYNCLFSSNPKHIAFFVVALWNKELTDYHNQKAEEEQRIKKQRYLEKFLGASYLSLSNQTAALELVSNIEEQELDADRNLWLINIDQILREKNRIRFEEIKKQKQKELEKINNEIGVLESDRKNAEIQELIRIDLIRLNSPIKYAAEAARERLARHGITISNCNTGESQ